jgi:AAA+ ATPase superfamily predicted ATPase
VEERPVFVDRAAEVAELRALAARRRPALAILYGRRRVGKTYLLRHAWRDQRLFYFLAADLPAARNRQELLRELAAWSGTAIDPADYPTWRTVFRLLLQHAAQEPLVVVLDEFQYVLRDPEDDAASQLVAVWDHDVADRPLVLTLCGSEVGTMSALAAGDAPLHGRASWSARLYPFRYDDAAAMVPHLAERDAALAYGVFGGTPRYLAAVDAGESVRDAAIRALLSPRGEVHLQLQTLVEQEKGIRNPAEYRAVLEAVAQGATLLNEIAQQASVDPHETRRILHVLEDLDLVERERNFGAGETVPFRYYVADHAVSFWHRFVLPSRSALETGSAPEIWDRVVAPSLDTYMGKVFERIVAQAYARRHDRWGLPPAREWSRWEGRDRNRRPIEVDLVARLDDGRVLAGEIKWSSRPRGFELHNGLRRDLDDLARSGHGWAVAALGGPFLYASAAGFEPAFVAWAAAQPNVTLLSLPDLYSR